MADFKKAGVKLGKTVINIISAQIIKYLSSEEFKNRLSLMVDEMVNLIVKAVVEEKKKFEKT